MINSSASLTANRPSTSWQIRAQAELEHRRREKLGIGVHEPPKHWRGWLTTLFADYVSSGFAQRHVELWKWIWSIKPKVKPRPFVAIWPREGGKSTTAELAAVALGARKIRHYIWYVRETQDQADGSVTNIMDLLESAGIEKYHPELGQRQIGKFGAPRSWRRQQLRTASGFIVDAIGLDTAVRGSKVKEKRPDFIILDDIDGKHDTAKTTRKKIETITTSLLPAGSQDCAILAIQNLIIPSGVFARLANVADEAADFLADRIVSGPHPAVADPIVEQRDGRFVLTGGTPTWDGQGLDVCQRNIDTWGYSAWRQEGQHEVEAPPGGIWDHIEFQRVTWEQVPTIERIAVWVDPAVTSTDESDSMGIQADGYGVDGTLYRFFSWEQVTSPEGALKKAIRKALELKTRFGCPVSVGIETDQGGDVWFPAFRHVWDELVKQGKITEDEPIIPLKQAKAGAGYGGKVERNQRMLTDYERGKVIHIEGTHLALERALKRFPKTKPLDLADAAFWGWNDLMANKVEVVNAGQWIAEWKKSRQ
jgi:hypothetical protein